MLYAGVDYSLTSPAICVYNADKGNFCLSNTKLYFLASKKMHEGYNDGTIESALYPQKWTTDEGRYCAISHWAITVLMWELGNRTNDEIKVWIEGYSFGSSGKVFHIAENTAILKHKLYNADISIQTVPPTTVKKFATGKGNATKDRMYECFLEETGADLMSELSPKASNVNSPVSDLVDAYFIAKYGYSQSQGEDDGK